MSSNSDIEWTDATWNPVVGCTRVGGDDSGCAHCYAERMAPRIEAKLDRPTTIKLAGKSKRPGLTFTPKNADGESLGLGARWTGSVWMLPDVLDTPLRWRAPKRVFVNSMSDLFHENLVDSEEGRRFIAAVFGVMAATPNNTYQVLTKRPDLAWRWFAWLEEKAEGLEDEAAPARACLSIALDALSAHADDASNSRARDRVRHAMQRDGLTWPLPNVWLGVSAEHQAAADERVPVLLVLPAAVRFVSYEPALGPVDWSAWLSRLDWLICGGESGTKARPMHPAWARSARDQCAAAGTAFFFKQWGQFSPVMREDWIADGRRPHAWVTLDGESGECWLASTDPDSPWLNYTGSPPTGAEAVGRGLVVMAGVGKAAAGRELDGHTHDDYPMARPVHGCDVCPHASLRFNSGDGATTCDLLDQQIVAVGRAKPGHRPAPCPLQASSSAPESSDG